MFGAEGFVGGHLVAYLGACGASYSTPHRHTIEDFKGNLGHVFYCIGVTSDFRTRQHDTVEAHVCLLNRLLQRTSFDSFVYLSSTQVYRNSATTDEDQRISLSPLHPIDLYAVTKLAGESICLSVGGPNVKIARLSNVFGLDPGSGTFLASVIRDAVTSKAVTVLSAPETSKDYVGINDIVGALLRLSQSGEHQIYNLASGQNTSHKQLLEQIRKNSGCSVEFKYDQPAEVFPVIDIERAGRDIGFQPGSVLNAIPDLVASFGNAFRGTNHDYDR